MMDDTIDFEAINRAALSIFQALVQDRFPNGKLKGNEFTVGNLQGDAGESLSINVRTGKWADFATSDCGGDPISLFAAADYAGSQIAAADWLGHRTGVIVNGNATTERRPTSSHVREEVAAGKQNPQPKPADTWKQLIPPPADMPKPTAQQLACDMLHEYCGADDRILSYVRRFEARNGKRKEFFPLTPGVLNGKIGWHPKHPDTPRPLYGINRLSTRPDALFMLCEGEKKADAAQRLFPDYACVSWSGGCKADHLADETPLLGRQGIIWGDADKGGQEAAARWAKRLQGARMVSVEGLSDGFDADDLEAQGCDDPEGWLSSRLPPAPEDAPDDDAIRVVKLPPVGRTKIAPRPWCYGTFMLFGHAAVLGAVDGGGKGSMAVGIMLSMITGKPLLGEKVWKKGSVAIITYEDSLDEWHRRISAACLLYELDYEYVIDNVIFLTKNRGRIRLAAMSRDGIVFPDSEAIIGALKSVSARLLVIDPFNHAHDTDDGNNNLVIAKVAGEAERIAREANVAVLALHHLRKGSVGSVDDLMGATSLRATFRSTRILARMTEDEGNKVGITKEHWRYSRIAGTKENYAPPPDKMTWFVLRSVELGNTDVDEIYPGGDQVQVTVAWTPPPLFEGLDREVLAEIFQKIRKGPAEGEHYSPARKANRWVGNLIIGAGEGEGKNAEQAASIVAIWLKSKLLVESQYRNPKSSKMEQMVSLDEAKASEILSSSPAPTVSEVVL